MPNDDRVNNAKRPGDKTANSEMAALVSEIVSSVVEKLNTEKPTQQPRQPSGREKEDGIDVFELFYLMMSKLKYILVAAVICAIAGGYYANVIAMPSSTATAKLYLVKGGDSLVNLSDLQLGISLAPDYQEVFKTWEVSEMVREDLGLNMSYSQLQSMLSVTNPDKTRLLYITVRNANPKLAADIANAYARAAKKFILETMETSEPNVFSIALVPSVITYVNERRYIIIGFMGGALIAMGLIFLYFMLDNRPKSPDDILKFAGIPTLAVIPTTRKKRKFPYVNKPRADRRM